MTTRLRSFKIPAFILTAIFLKFYVADKLLETTSWWLQAFVIIGIFVVGFGYIFRGTADVIEETTDVLKDRTGLAGGLLQAFGTAFPDMIIGIVAAVLSLQVRSADPARAINLAILAAAATFGSNIYNILHAAWCVWRQNLADALGKRVPMLPLVASFGVVRPLSEHKTKPSSREMAGAIRILAALTLLTSFVAVSMVLFGKVSGGIPGITGDIYELTLPVGIVLLALCLAILYLFRKNQRPESPLEDVLREERFYEKQSTPRIWTDLILSGIAILFVAEAMVRAMEAFSLLVHMPFVITGVLAGIIGCFGEMIIVHNFSIHPKGRIGDAIVGVAMDNIVTTLGASLVAIMGGIFLGGDSLILIFIIILAGNTILIEQISELKSKLPRV